MLNKLFYILLFTTLAACSDASNETDLNKPGTVEKNSQSATRAEQIEVNYRMISTEEGEDDASLPQGYWQSLITYPELSGNIDDSIKTKINNDIITLSKKYSCETHGDYSFSSEVKVLNSNLFSMTYEIMWMCPQMASPDSTIGALNYNLRSGEIINLESEFTNASAYNDILLMISSKFIGQNKDNNDCPVKDKYSYFYSNQTSLVFVADVEHHSDSGCISEIIISKDTIAGHLKPDSVLLH